MVTKKKAVTVKPIASASRKKAGEIPEAGKESAPDRRRAGSDPEKTTTSSKLAGRVARVRAPAKKKNSKSALVKKLLDAAEKKVTADDVKASIGDVIRLLQLQKELEHEEPREIKVQWIEREEKGHVREK